MANVINSLNFNNTQYVFTLPYGECSTAAATAAKVVNNVDNFHLETGARIAVKFTVANSATGVTLNVNGSGAKSVLWHGAGAVALRKDEIYELVYTGTNWEIIGQADTNTTYSAATTTTAGLMSAADKVKLNGIATGANAYTHPSYTARTGVPTANATLTHGGTFAVTQPVSDASGHITAMNSRTYTMPSETTLSKGTNTTASATLTHGGTFKAQTATTVSGHKVTDTITTFTMPSETTLSKGTAINGSVTLKHGGTFDAISGFSVDGHTITPTMTTFTLPADSNTKNTAGASASTAKLFLIGATTQSASPQTYSNSAVYMTNGTLNASTFAGYLNGTAAKASSATKATSATTATNAGTATYATSAGSATNASTATYATSAGSASKATTCTNAGTAMYSTRALAADNAGTAAYATNAGTAAYATNSGTATYAKSAATATRLKTSRTVRTNLGSTATASFNGTANITPGVQGVLPVAYGGTGSTTAAGALTNLGLTATATELNYCDGVTSNIQTQINWIGEHAFFGKTNIFDGSTNWNDAINNSAYKITSLTGQNSPPSNNQYGVLRVFDTCIAGSPCLVQEYTTTSNETFTRICYDNTFYAWRSEAPFFRVTSTSDMTTVFSTLALNQTANIWIEGAYFKTLTNSLDAGNQAHGYATKLTNSILELRVGGGGYHWTIRFDGSAATSQYRATDNIAYQTTDLTAGSSSLPTGHMMLVYS